MLLHFSQLQTIYQKPYKSTMISSQDVDVFEITPYCFSNMKCFPINFISTHVTVNTMKLLIIQLQLLITKNYNTNVFCFACTVAWFQLYLLGVFELKSWPKAVKFSYNFSLCHWNLNSCTVHDSLALINWSKYDMKCLSEKYLDSFVANDNL